MPTRQLDRFVHHLRRSLLLKDGGGMTDGKLLGQFIERRDEAAFEALVRRHGPMVLGVCQRLLGNAHDAEDAFQATFLVLVRRAASIRKRDLVGNWLYGVAYRTGLDFRRASGGFEMGRPAQSGSLTNPRPQLLAYHLLSTVDFAVQELFLSISQSANSVPM
jgi:hypothetical protein